MATAPAETTEQAGTQAGTSADSTPVEFQGRSNERSN